jgi:hypothetical protein
VRSCNSRNRPIHSRIPSAKWTTRERTSAEAERARVMRDGEISAGVHLTYIIFKNIMFFT